MRYHSFGLSASSAGRIHREPRASLRIQWATGQSGEYMTMRSRTTPDPDAYVGAPAIETDLIERAKGRDEAAIRAIIKTNNQRLYRLARGILCDDSEAEDVAQDTYIRTPRQRAIKLLTRISLRTRRRRPCRKRQAILLITAAFIPT